MTKTPSQANHLLNVEKLSDKVIGLSERLGIVEEHQDSLNGGIDRVEKTINREIKPGLNSVHKRIDKLQFWIMATLATIVVGFMFLFLK